MQSIYCHCGALNEYRGLKPKYCSSCGDSLDSTAAFRRADSEGAEDPEEGATIGGERFRNHAPAHLGMDILVEIEGGAEISTAGQVVPKVNRKLTRHDARGGSPSIASMSKQV